MMTYLFRTLVVAATVCAAAAQPIPKLKSISHEYVQRGSRLEVTILGENLNATEFLVSGESGVQFKLPPAAESVIGVEASAGGITAVEKSDQYKLVDIDVVVGTSERGAS